MAETSGNPLAILELSRGGSAAEVGGGFGLTDALPLSGRIEASFQRRIDALSQDARLLSVVAAAEPVGDSTLVRGAAGRLGLDDPAAREAELTGLVDIGRTVVFRHPLVRSAVYRSAAGSERRRVHAALAEATDPTVDPDRHAWHRAHATLGPDDRVAAELELSARPQDTQALRRVHRVVQECGLADAGFAPHDENPAFARTGGGQHLVE